MDSASLIKTSESPSDSQIAPMTAEERSTLIVKTYENLFWATVAFGFLETLLLGIVGPGKIYELLTIEPRVSALVVGGIDIVGLFLALLPLAGNPRRWRQYVSLGLFVLLYVAIMAPGFAIALTLVGTKVVFQAIGITVALFIALTSAVFMTRANFTILRAGLLYGTFAAIVLIIASCIFGFELGIGFSWTMACVACGWILHDTSVVLREAKPGDDVKCAIDIFLSLMLLLSYVLDILSGPDRG
ncbi:MAG: Bax inhibitor-1 family protein [Thermoguttaceae bacterium]|nr:Bax inhibitor-1 family protein [Thermoguttaceae bacterium]